MKTIAQQLKVKDFPFEIKDKNNNLIYWEDSEGFWSKREWDLENNHQIYFEKSDGYWAKKEWDSTGLIYFEDSNGEIIDNRPKTTPEYTMEELIAKVGYEFKIKK